MENWLKDFVHNCVIHPLMPFLSTSFATQMHDRNADWAFGGNRFDEVAIEKSMAITPVKLDRGDFLSGDNLYTAFPAIEMDSCKGCAAEFGDRLCDSFPSCADGDAMCKEIRSYTGVVYKIKELS